MRTPHGDSWNGPLHGLKFGFPHHFPSRFLIPCQVRDVSSFCAIPLQPPRITSDFALFSAPCKLPRPSVPSPLQVAPTAAQYVKFCSSFPPPANARDHPFQVHSRYVSSGRYILPRGDSWSGPHHGWLDKILSCRNSNTCPVADVMCLLNSHLKYEGFRMEFPPETFG